MTRRTQSEWSALIQKFEQSGLSQVDFCAQRNINAKYFSLRKTKLMAAGQSTAFVTATVPQVSDLGTATLHYGNVRLQLPVQATQAIAQLVRVLA